MIKLTEKDSEELHVKQLTLAITFLDLFKKKILFLLALCVHNMFPIVFCEMDWMSHLNTT